MRNRRRRGWPGVRIAPKLRTSRCSRLSYRSRSVPCRGGRRLGLLHAKPQKHAVEVLLCETALEVIDSTPLERHSSVLLAPEPIRVHITKGEEDHDREGERAHRRDWQEPLGNGDRTCSSAVSSGEASALAFG